MIDDEKYENAVDEAFERLSKANTPDELKEVLANWPDREKYTVENVPELTNYELKDLGYEIEDIQE